MITNRLKLPEPIFNAVQNDDYSKGDADISITSLISPPRIVALKNKHKDEISEDCSDRIWALLGQLMHSLLERANAVGMSEKRLYINVGGWRISGQVDLYQDGVVCDYKLITVYKFKGGKVPEEYEQQLNLYAEILRQNGYPVTKLQIAAVYRDFSKMEAKRDAAYPQAQVEIHNVPLWPEAKAQAFLGGRVKLHQDALKALPLCSSEEKWERPTVYAVHKEGRKTAVKLHDNLLSATNHAASEPGLYVDKRQGEAIRCGNYCSVSRFCDVYQNYIKEISNAISKTGT